MTNQTESERLYVVETKLDALLIAIEKTNSKLDNLVSSLDRYATKEELEHALEERDREIADLKVADVGLAKKHAFQVWITGTMSAMFGAVLAILIKIAFE